MSDDFKHCRALGLLMMRSHWAGHAEGDGWQYVVSASDLEALLAKGVRVTCESAIADMPRLLPGPFNKWSQTEGANDTHTALLIDIQPIRKESAEEVLRDFIMNTLKRDGRKGVDTYEMREGANIVERARRALENNG